MFPGVQIGTGLTGAEQRQRQESVSAFKDRLPADHKARWFSGAALNTGDQAMASVMSTVMSRLNAFLDSEMEQVLCFDTTIDAERFCNEKSAVFIVMPEENPNAYFMVSLLIQQLYREILAVADENGGTLPNRAMFYCDEFGTLPPIQSAEMMYSASRSRRLSIVSIIQSYQQLEKNYGKEGARHHTRQLSAHYRRRICAFKRNGRHHFKGAWYADSYDRFSIKK